MNKFLKLTGVSMLAIVAASNANAAGYTCEELVEYESCNPTYYLSTNVSCPSGYRYVEALCIANDETVSIIYPSELTEDYNTYEKYCQDYDSGKYFGSGCLTDDLEEADWLDRSEFYDTEFVAGTVTRDCLSCPDGYTCDGGTAQPYVGACEPGYTKQMLCPAGYELYENVCTDGNGYWQENSEESCGDYEWMTAACLKSLDYGWSDNLAKPLVAGPTCGKCPMGYLCEGGDKAATTCPAGSYCATAGLSQPTGLCTAGTFSFAGASACSTCPEHEYTNANGQTVSVPATTVPATGAGSVSACIIDSDKTFTDIKGTYHFKENCAYDAVLYPSCEYYDIFLQNNPSDYDCLADNEFVGICGDGDADCIKNLSYNCSLYQSAYENEVCEENEDYEYVCTVDLGHGIKCE